MGALSNGKTPAAYIMGEACQEQADESKDEDGAGGGGGGGWGGDDAVSQSSGVCETNGAFQHGVGVEEVMGWR